MIFLGCDPDTQRTAWAAVRQLPVTMQPEVLLVRLTKADKGTTGKDAVLSLIRNIPKTDIDDLFVADASLVALIVESQELAYSAKQGASPRDVALLGPVSGAVMMWAGMRLPLVHTYFPSPQEWKGSRSKCVHHPQICNTLGWDYEVAGGKEPYAVPRFIGGQAPRGADDLNKSDWKHVMDAIGLAIWGMRQWQQEQTKQRYLAEARSK